MMVEVLAPGALTTVQDRGRFGLRRLGIGACGAADPFSPAVANLLLGNAADAAVLEITLAGPRLLFESACAVALCGGDIDAELDGRALPGWRPLPVAAGSELRLGGLRSGCRSYLAVAGGIDVPLVLGSRSTDLRGRFGGVDGRALQAGDRLPIGAAPQARAHPPSTPRWSVDPRPDLEFDRSCLLHLLPGADLLQSSDALFETRWIVDPASNRQGVRLQGPPLRLRDSSSRISAPVLPGTVQLPPDGQPIVLLADAQTVGGYPCIGHVALADLCRAGQLRPGEPVHFLPCSEPDARRRYAAQKQRLQRMAIAIEARRRRDGVHPMHARAAP